MSCLAESNAAMQPSPTRTVAVRLEGLPVPLHIHPPVHEVSQSRFCSEASYSTHRDVYPEWFAEVDCSEIGKNDLLHAAIYGDVNMLASDLRSSSPALDLYKSVLALRDEAVRARSVHFDDPNALILSTRLEYALLDFLAQHRVDDGGNLYHVRMRARDQHGTPMLRSTPAVRPHPTDGNDSDEPPRRAPRRAAEAPSEVPRLPPPVDFKGLCRAVLASYGVQSTPHDECTAPAMRAVRLEAGPTQTAAYKATGMPPSRCSAALS